ncbi:MAG: CCDC90 family protein [Magnetococcus sp. YQC-5]
MSYAVPFDTLAFVRELENAGIPPAHAEAQAKALTTVVRQIDARVDDLATKRDKQAEEKFDALADRNEERVKSRLDGLATKQEMDTKIDAKFKELDIKIEATKTELKRDLKELELRMVIKLGAMFLAAFGLLRLWPIPVQYVPPAPHAQEMRLPAPVSTLPAAPSSAPPLPAPAVPPAR